MGAAVLLKAFDSGEQTLFVGVDEETEMFKRIRAFVTAVHERFEWHNPLYPTDFHSTMA